MINYYDVLMREIPDGYIAGLVRDPIETNRHVAHLYKGTFSDPGNPMCAHGWNRGDGYSIWRNVIGSGGICKVCLRRAHEGRDPVPPIVDEEEKDTEEYEDHSLLSNTE